MGKLAVNTLFGDSRDVSDGLRRVCCKFTTNNTADPVATNNVGIGVTVTRIGVGRFRCTMGRAFRQFIGASAVPVSTTRIGVTVAYSVGNIRNPATVDIEIQSALGTAVETTGLEVSFWSDFRDVVTHKGN
jgi:hypothetical protein